MYYVSKTIQAAGLGMILIGFISQLPNVLDRKLFTIGILTFVLGWMIQKFLLKH